LAGITRPLGRPTAASDGEDGVTLLSMLRGSLSHRLAGPLLVAASMIMIVLGKVDQAIFERVRVSVTDHTAPILGLLSQPLTMISDAAGQVRVLVDLYRDDMRLRQENQKLMHWQQAALALADQNRGLRDLLHLVPETARSFVSARVIATSGGAYLRNLLVDAGSENGVARGQAVVVGEGLVGRVYEAGTHAVRVLLITDLNSRVPVIVERSRQRAILAGDNSPLPLLWYLDPAAPLLAGDRLVTSGEGGIFPPGLPVGVVAAVGSAAPRVQPYVRLSQIDYVRIVDYGLTQGLPKAVPPPAPRSARGAGGR
jgi:rod shape-determining protein MreC